MWTLLIFPGEFLSLYRDDAGLVAYAIPSLQVIVVAMLIMAVSTVMFNAVVGTGKTVVNLTMEICCVSCYLVYSYIVIERPAQPTIHMLGCGVRVLEHIADRLAPIPEKRPVEGESDLSFYCLFCYIVHVDAIVAFVIYTFTIFYKNDLW